MFTHHIVTCILIIGSYYYYYTRVGHVILFLMDVVDIQLSLAKIFKYFEWNRLCDATFIVFMLTWAVTRHGFFNYILKSAMTSAIELIPLQCYYDANGELVRCFTPAVHWTLVFLLGVLQIITIFWFFMVLRVAYNVVRGNAATDTRSDDEDTEDEAEESKDEEENKDK